MVEDIKNRKGEGTNPDSDSLLNKAKGAVIGALMGDAIGAVLEFHFQKIGRREISRAFQMIGGGAHNVGPG